MSDRIRYVVALVVGLLAIPGLAFATSSALSSNEPGETTDAPGAVATSTTTADPSAISAEDLVRACGVEGAYLVDLEAARTIDEVQQAALNALRPICEEAGLPLPAAPVVESETIVETVTVVRAGPGSAAVPGTSTTTTLAGNEDDDASEAFSAQERALAAIEMAKVMGGNPEKINQAIALVERGNAAYEAGDYDQAEELYEEAEHQALEAQLQRQDHEDDDHEDDHEDDDHEDDHEDDDHEDDHHEDDHHEDDD